MCCFTTNKLIVGLPNEFLMDKSSTTMKGLCFFNAQVDIVLCNSRILIIHLVGISLALPSYENNILKPTKLGKLYDQVQLG